MSFNFFLFFLMVLLLIFLFNTKIHYMRAILILEAMMLTALLISFYVLSLLHGEPFLFLLLLTFAVCEAALGLSLLLTYIKATGSDMIKSSLI
uniref:NADH-ubiquinone oxidoreductase chain 4L n=1 Tax=Stereophaedusa gouldi TaxID=1885799 RepID=A0A224AAH0_9EUPU|nr:NADH dehydrogenase subunit 4L [Stereophaedusa gouldi]BBA10166.1 NADH dehydrogenase subunit 4L [Stereophaedusa gouldi]BBA10391.1 NADH dehydrogenase subunit 4L [Stereophaedusa gouldi]